MSLVGSEWVLYLLILLSILSIAVILDRLRFIGSARNGLVEFRNQIRIAAEDGRLDDALKVAESRIKGKLATPPDLESHLAVAILSHKRTGKGDPSAEVLNELAQDAVIRIRLQWEKNLAILATIGANAPFIGLFGTVLGIIKAFHDLSQQATAGAQGVTAGVADALIATAVGILVAIPAVVAYNLLSRRVKAALGEAEALKCYLVGQIAGRGARDGT